MGQVRPRLHGNVVNDDMRNNEATARFYTLLRSSYYCVYIILHYSFLSAISLLHLTIWAFFRA